jgi:hypothetical protein
MRSNPSNLRKTTFSILIVLFASAILLSGIVNLIPVIVLSQTQPAASYFPLAIGNSWTYTVTSGTQTGTIVVTIDSKESVGDVDCYVRATAMQQGNQRECYAWRGDQLYLYKTVVDYQTFFYQPPLLYLSSPLETGHTWSWQGKATSDSGTVAYTATETFAVIGPAKVVVPAGAFDSIGVKVTHTDGGVFDGIRWFASGVGLVKEVRTVQGVTTNVELSYFQSSNQQSSASLSSSQSEQTTSEIQGAVNTFPAAAVWIGIGMVGAGTLILAYRLRRKRRLLISAILVGIAVAGTLYLAYPSITHTTTEFAIGSSTNVSYGTSLTMSFVTYTTSSQRCAEECTYRFSTSISSSNSYVTAQFLSTQTFTSTSYRTEFIPPYETAGLMTTDFAFLTALEYAILVGAVLFLFSSSRTVAKKTSPVLKTGEKRIGDSDYDFDSSLQRNSAQEPNTRNELHVCSRHNFVMSYNISEKRYFCPLCQSKARRYLPKQRFGTQGTNSSLLRAGTIALLSAFVSVSSFDFLPCGMRALGIAGLVILWVGLRGKSGKEKLVGGGVYLLFFLLFLFAFVRLFPQMVNYSYC